ncbi:NAD-dependent epimerase/dehydratase family protein [Halocatena marina]|uniref:NAD-dependent epimerase/dehydratase family protein n=1 Tax=Halocatena marina TaxID=2934937 RepID=UPI00200F003B|nr:NAD-dependent epimerase/dehydratase family protein [Halocatena marina]
MELTGKRLVVTGGAGLIGSVLSNRLAVDNDVLVVDDLSNGIRKSVPDGVTFVEGDLTDRSLVADVITEDVDGVFHLAAADKYVDTDEPRAQFEANGEMTYNILERMDEVGVSNIAFTSSCTVYGEAGEPTPETYGPLEPISIYGATKLADESLLSVYGHTHDFTVWTFRFANIVGPRFGAGVVPDFVEKLDANPETLTILGNGKQEKSYMHVEECVDAMCHIVEHADEPVNIYNLATQSTTSVDRVAEIVSEEMGLDPDYEYTGGERGWTGDVSTVLLPIDKLLDLGWENELSSDESVRQVAREIIDLLD